MKYLIINFLGLVLTISNLYGQIRTVTVTGGWSVAVPNTIISEAGLNYTTNITSATNQTLLEITAAKNDPYTVFIQRQDTDWNAGLTLWARRTGTGNGGASINGGLNYIQLTTAAQTFFSGVIAQQAGPRVTNIPIQYEIRGLSVLLPVKSYSTTILYTVTSP